MRYFDRSENAERLLQDPSTPAQTLKPNHGSNVPEELAFDDHESQEVWLERMGIDTSKQIRLKKLVHMRYQHPDLDEINTFMLGMSLSLLEKNALVYCTLEQCHEVLIC